MSKMSLVLSFVGNVAKIGVYKFKPFTHKKPKIHVAKKFLDNKEIQNWTNLIILTGNLEPVGKFENVKIEDWIKNYKLNFLSQIYLLKNLLNYKNKYLSKVIFTSGGSTNSDDENLSSYNLAKIGLIKLCELLNREIKISPAIMAGLSIRAIMATI